MARRHRKNANFPDSLWFQALGRVRGANAILRAEGELPMATRLQRLAEFDGNGEPSPDEAVQVLCEDKSGTYQLPFSCRRVNGEWRNSESGGLVEATVVGWRRARI
jgi:hypothetical protein